MVYIKCDRSVVSEKDAQVYATSELGEDHDCYVFEFAEVHLLDQFLDSSNEFQEIHCVKIDVKIDEKVHQRSGSIEMILVHILGQIIWFATKTDDDTTFEEIAKPLVGNLQKCVPGKIAL